MENKTIAARAGNAVVAGLLMLIQSWVSGLPVAQAGIAPVVSQQARRQGQLESYGKIPMRFDVNEGQTAPEVKFVSRGAGYTLFLTDDEAILSLFKASPKDREAPATQSAAPQPRGAVMRMKLLGANRSARPTGLEKLPGRDNYYVGSQASKWLTNVPAYGRVKYEAVYPGIDLVYYGNQRQVEYDFVVAPGADPGAIKLAFSGDADSHSNARQPPRVDARGDLVVRGGEGEVRFERPALYQMSASGRRVPVMGQYAVNRAGVIGFDVGRYDRKIPLIIDPVLGYSTYLGAGLGDMAFGIAVDSAGNIFLAGSTSSMDFPTANALQSALGGSSSCFVARIKADGSALDYSTFLGGTNGFGYCEAIGVDGAGDAYVVGGTTAPDFPTLNAFQNAYGGGISDAFVSHIRADGTLAYSSFLGGSLDDEARAIAVNTAGTAYVTGGTSSIDFPIRAAQQAVHGGAGFDIYSPNTDAFVTQIAADGSLLASTFLGGSNFYSDGNDYGRGIAVDVNGDVYVTGITSANDFPTLNAAQATLKSTDGGFDAFVSRISGDRSQLSYSTYLGGRGDESGRAIAVDDLGNAYVTGRTCSADYPTKNALQGVRAQCSAYVTKIDTNQVGPASIVFSTYLGGNADGPYDTRGRAIALSGNNIFVAGATGQTDFPVTGNALQKTLTYPTGTFPEDAFVSELSSDGSQLLYSSYLGGSDADEAESLAVAGSSVYVAGFTTSTDFPTTPNAIRPHIGDYATSPGDAFVTKIVFKPSVVLPPPILQGVLLAGEGSAPFTVTAADGFNQPVSFNITGQPAGMTVAPGHFTLAPPANGSATQAISFTVGPAVASGTYSLLVAEDGTISSVPITVTVTATTGGASQVVGSIQAAGCISNPAIASALKAELNLAQNFVNSHRTKLALDTYGAMLVEIATLSSRNLIAPTCSIGGVRFSPSLVLAADVRGLMAGLRTN